MSCGCPEGYFLNSSTGLCQKLVRTDADLVVSPKLPKQICTSPYFCRRGSAWYPTITSSQYPLQGISSTLPTFQDTLGAIITPSATLVSGLWIGGDEDRGRLNLAGIGLLPPANEWQGYSSCIQVEEGDLFTVGISASYGFRIFIDGELAVNYLPIPPVTPAEYYHLFTFDLSEGLHNILFEGLSRDVTGRACRDRYGADIACNSVYAVYPPQNCPNLGTLVGEIFKNVTPQILSNTADQNALNKLYAKRYANSSEQYITTLLLCGSPTDTGTNGNYSCEAGYLNSCFPGYMKCDSWVTTSSGACCYDLVNCKTGEVDIVTNTNLNTYLDKIVEVDGNCYMININSSEDCSGAVSVTVDAYFDDCETCTRVYYRLIDCRGVADDIVVYGDLSEYLGKIIQIFEHGACWMISQNVPSTENAVEVEVFADYETCQTCIDNG